MVAIAMMRMPVVAWISRVSDYGSVCLSIPVVFGLTVARACVTGAGRLVEMVLHACKRVVPTTAQP